MIAFLGYGSKIERGLTEEVLVRLLRRCVLLSRTRLAANSKGEFCLAL